MPPVSHHVPPTAMEVTTYRQLTELVQAFATCRLHLLVILARPGLGKSQILLKAIKGTHAQYYKTRNAPIKFYIHCYEFVDEPIAIDDCDSMLGDKQFRELLRSLTETDDHKLLQWDTQNHELGENGVPTRFYTSSPVCIITNSWNSNDKMCEAIESRAEFVNFIPTTTEVYKYVSTWFTDQEIYDYWRERIPILRDLDVRILAKALKRKIGGLRSMPWQQAIDNHCEDAEGLYLRRLVADRSLKTNDARCHLWCEETGRDRATFYRRLAALRRLGTLEVPQRIVLRHSNSVGGR